MTAITSAHNIYKYNIVGYCLIISCIFIPFTELRFGLFGIGEIFLVIAFALLIYVTNGKIRFNNSNLLFLHFWLPFICVICVGFVLNYFILGHKSGTLEQAGFDLAAYFVVLLFFFLVGDYRIFGISGPVKFCLRVYLIWFGIFLSLYYISLSSPSIFGMKLRHYDAFSPLVSNIHQASMLFCVLPFLGMYLFAVNKSLLGRIWIAVSIPMYVIMALESNSTKALIALLSGTSVFVIWFLIYRPKGKHRHYINLLILLIILFMITTVTLKYGDLIINIVISFIKVEDSSQAREILYSYSIKHALDSFIIGYGPGGHAVYLEGFYSDAHSTLLTALLQGGIIGLTLLLVFAVKYARMVSVSSALMACLAAISIYGIGGDILRRLPVWIVLFAIYVLADSRRKQIQFGTIHEEKNRENTLKIAPSI